MTELLSQAEIDQRLGDLHDDWAGSGEALRRKIEFADFLTAVRFVDEIAPRCEELDHHPDLTLSWRNVGLALSTHSDGGVTEKDFALATAIDAVVAALPLA